MRQDYDIIPIDDALSDFKFHLINHPRTIFSAGFGEGKTFFLKKFQETSQDFVFVTLYPVNYQVASNQDIFDLVKRDILFQLFTKGIYTPSQSISPNVAISFFLCNHINYIEWVIKSANLLDYPKHTAINAIGTAIKFLKRVKEKFSEFCDKYNVDENNCMELWEKIEESKTIYECDAVTKLIQESIEEWKKQNPSKKIALLIEDMDRIDPAHLFRILNVLSAHIDYSYKIGISPNENSINNNKFGFDNLICVLDYNNLISIFKHFYGEQTSLEGYISKFSSKGYFSYSLSNQKTKYYYSQVEAICGIKQDIIKLFIQEKIVELKSLRELNASIDNIDIQIKTPQNYCKNNTNKEYPLQLLKLFVILRRLGKTNAEIIEITNNTIYRHESLKNYIIPFIFLKENLNLCIVSFGEKQHGGYLVEYDFSEFNEDKHFKYKTQLISGYNLNRTFPKFKEIIGFMLTLVGY